METGREREDGAEGVGHDDPTSVSRRGGGGGHSGSELPTSADPPMGPVWPEDPTAGALGGEGSVPVRVGRYRVMRALGDGGMGVVFEAEQDVTLQRVALKMMRPGLVGPTALRRFENEVRTLGRLNHPNVARVYDAELGDGGGGGVGGGRAWIAMELLRGAQSITGFARGRGLGVMERVGLFVEACRGIEHAHAAGVVHRDLKPSNILVEPWEGAALGGRVKVIDFGIARSVERGAEGEDVGGVGGVGRGDGDETASTRTKAGQIVGTLTYMSPEQCGGRPEDVDQRSDVYALGVVLYELLTRSLPYPLRDATTGVAMRMIREARPVPVGERDGSLRGDLEAIIGRCLEKDPGKRYADVASLRADLERFLAGRAVSVRRGEGWYVARCEVGVWIARRPWVAGLAAMLAGWLVYPVAIDAVFRWTPVHGWYARAVRVLATPTALSGPRGPDEGAVGVAGMGSDVRGLEHVALVSITEASDMAALARERGIEGVLDGYREDPLHPGAAAERRTWRALHAAMTDRLVEAGVRVIGWDIAFESPAAGDEAFAAAMQRGRERGVDTVLAAARWVVDANGLPTISPRLLDVAGFGITRGGATSAGAWAPVLMVDRARVGVLPSLTVAMLVAARHPGAMPELALRDGDVLEIGAARREDVGGGRWASTRLGVPERVRLGEVKAGAEMMALPAPAGMLPGGYEPEDRVGIMTVEIPADGVIAASTMEYGEVLGSDLEVVRRRLEGKAVVVANLRRGMDVVPLSDGRVIRGPWTHLASYEALARVAMGRVDAATRMVMENPSSLVMSLAWVVCAALGVAAGAVGSRWAWPAALMVVSAAGVLIVAVSVGWLAMRPLLWDPFPGVIVATVAWGVTWGLLRLRPRRPMWLGAGV